MSLRVVKIVYLAYTHMYYVYAKWYACTSVCVCVYQKHEQLNLKMHDLDVRYHLDSDVASLRTSVSGEFPGPVVDVM